MQPKTWLKSCNSFVATIVRLRGFVYESVFNWIMGDNVLIVNALICLIMKLLTMVLCFSFAIYLAPIAWIYIFWYFKFGDGKCDFNGDLQDRDGIITAECDD